MDLSEFSKKRIHERTGNKSLEREESSSDERSFLRLEKYGMAIR